MANTRDQARYQEFLLSTVMRLATQLAASGSEGRRALHRVRLQDIEGALHEIADEALRAELIKLSETLLRLTSAKQIDLDATERHFSGRANQGTRGRGAFHASRPQRLVVKGPGN